MDELGFDTFDFHSPVSSIEEELGRVDVMQDDASVRSLDAYVLDIDSVGTDFPVQRLDMKMVEMMMRDVQFDMGADEFVSKRYDEPVTDDGMLDR